MLNMSWATWYSLKWVRKELKLKESGISLGLIDAILDLKICYYDLYFLLLFSKP